MTIGVAVLIVVSWAAGAAAGLAKLFSYMMSSLFILVFIEKTKTFNHNNDFEFIFKSLSFIGLMTFGFSFIYQDMKNDVLGENYGLYAHYNLYFLKRRLNLRLGQGIAYNTNPYDKVTNFKNNAYGSHLLSTTYLMLNYKKEKLFKGFGLQAGISVIHYSNANIKAPNTSTNSFVFNVGTNYVFDYENEPEYIPSTEEKKFKGFICLYFYLTKQ